MIVAAMAAIRVIVASEIPGVPYVYWRRHRIPDRGPSGFGAPVAGSSGLGHAMRSAFAAGTVALRTRAAEEFSHGLASPASALSGGKARGVEMLGDGL